MHVAHREIVALDADAGAVVVANRDARALDPFDQHALGFDHQGGLAFDRVAAQVGAGLSPRSSRPGVSMMAPSAYTPGARMTRSPGRGGIQRIPEATVTTVRSRGAGGTDLERAGGVCAVGSTRRSGLLESVRRSGFVRLRQVCRPDCPRRATFKE